MTQEYCPECDKLVEFEYDSIEVYCEDCGSHSGTQCPECDEQFDHVWGYDKIDKYQNERKGPNRSK